MFYIRVYMVIQGPRLLHGDQLTIFGKTGSGHHTPLGPPLAVELAVLAGCSPRGARGEWGVAGWGVHVLDVPEEEDAESTIRADLWGPVVTEEADVFFCGATRGTNNTGELIGIGQGLMWLRDMAGNTRGEAVMLYDSGYAANVTTGRWKPNANHALVAWTQKLLAEVEATRQVHWVHVKGHSADGGNDRADALVQRGKSDGPYARLRNNGGEGDSRHGAAANWVAPQ